MITELRIEDIVADLIRKEIRNLHLRVSAPDGRVRISAPQRMSIDTIRSFVISKLDWIRKHQQKIGQRVHEVPLSYLDGEIHYAWGGRYILKLIEVNRSPFVELEHGHMLLHVRPGTDKRTRASIIEAWYRDQLKEAIPPLIARWEPVMGVKVRQFFVRKMKTKWGSCNPRRQTIRLNTDLAKKRRELLEYVVVHEMVHFLSRRHDKRFYGYMDRFLPDWRHYRRELNSGPLRHDGEY